MLVKETVFKGLDVKTNPLEIDPAKASDCLNVYVDNSNQLRNRPYFKEYTFSAGVIPGEIKGLHEVTFKSFADDTKGINKRYNLAFVSGNNIAPGGASPTRGRIYKFNSLPSGGTVFQNTNTIAESAALDNYRSMPAQYSHDAHKYGAPFLPNLPVKPVVSEGVAYFLGTYGLWKCDGLVTMRAGSPYGSALIGGGAAGGTHYYRTFLAHFDFSGAWVFGDYQEQNSNTSGVSTNAKYYYSPPLGESSITAGLFDASYVIVSGAPTYDSGSYATATEIRMPSTQNNVSSGDWLTIYGEAFQGAGSGSNIFKIRVKSKSATVVTLDLNNLFKCDLAAGGGFKRVVYPYGPTTWYASNGLISNYVMAVYYSTAASSGYTLKGLGPIDPDLLTTIPVNTAATMSLNEYVPFTNTFEGCYDESKVKGHLPENVLGGTTEHYYSSDGGTDMKYLALFGDTLLASDGKYVYYSDPNSVGSCIENFDPRDFFFVGSDEDGPIVGLFANDEYIVVHREKASYYVIANLATGNFKSQKILTDKTGSLFHWGQEAILGQNFHISDKGAHIITRGGAFNDLGDTVDPIIKNQMSSDFGSFPTVITNYPMVLSTVDDQRNHVYTAYSHSTYSEVLVYNYRIKEWYRWRIPVMANNTSYFKGGMNVYQKNIWVTNGTSIFVGSEENTVADSAFTEAYWASVFRDMKIPSLEKKYTYLKLFSLNGNSFDCTVETRYDWESGSYEEQGVLTLPNPEVSPSQGFDLIDLTARRCFAMQFKVSSPGYLKLTGYELTEELVQEEIKR